MPIFRSDLTVQDRILKTRVLASLGFCMPYKESSKWRPVLLRAGFVLVHTSSSTLRSQNGLTKGNLVSVTFQQAMAKFAPRMGDPHGDPQTSPQHANPHGFLVWFSLKLQKVHVDRRAVTWSAGRHVDHPRGGQISPWPVRKVTDCGKTDREGSCSKAAGVT